MNAMNELIDILLSFTPEQLQKFLNHPTTKAILQNNCSHNRMITYNGKTQTLKQWSDELGIKYVTLLTRLNRYNWEIEKALIPPKK